MSEAGVGVENTLSAPPLLICKGDRPGGEIHMFEEQGAINF